MGMLQVLARFMSPRVAYLLRKKSFPARIAPGSFACGFRDRGGEKRALRGLLSEACHEIEAFLCGTLRDFVMRRFPIGVE